MCKAVQNFCTFTELLDRKSVIFLIKEESRLLSVFDIYFVFDTILFNLYKCRKFRSNETLHQFHSFLFAYLDITSLINATDDDTILCKNFPDQFYNCFFETVNSQCK